MALKVGERGKDGGGEVEGRAYWFDVWGKEHSMTRLHHFIPASATRGRVSQGKGGAARSTVSHPQVWLSSDARGETLKPLNPQT